MSIAWRKIAADIRLRRKRVAAVFLAVTIGSAALATALGARAVLRREVASSFAAALPPSITVVTDRVDESLLAAIREVPGVLDADSRRLVRARVEVAGQWLPMLLYAVRDFRDLRVSRIYPRGGAFPPRDGEILLEQSAIEVVAAETGASLHLRVPGRTADVRIAGLVHDPAQAPGWQDHEGYGYVTPQTLAALGLGDQLDEIRVRTSVDRAETIAISELVNQRVRASGHVVRRIEVLPGTHPHADHMAVVLTLLTAFGALALFLAGALTTTVMAFVMTRSSGEIATMKTLGASQRRIASLYLRFILVIALPAVVLGMVVGTFVGHRFEDFAARQLNLLVSDRTVPVGVLLAQFLVCLAVPILGSIPHVFRAARATVRGALLDQARAGGRTSRASKTENLARSLAWRGLFRRRGRLITTVAALSLGGAALMTAVNVYRGLIATVDRGLERRGDDIEVRLVRAVPLQDLRAAVAAVPGVRTVEVWGAGLAAIQLASGSGSSGTDRYSVLAPPVDTQHFAGTFVAGRPVDPASADEVVVNRALVAREPSVSLDARVVLVVEGHHTAVRVVGVVEELGQPTFYASKGVVEDLLQVADVGGALRLTVDGEQTRVASDLEEVLISRGWFPSVVMTRQTLRKAMTDHFLIMLMLLSSAALAAVIVGALSLGTSTSLNVLERSREIAIMRAIGATDRRVRGLLLTENAMLVAISVLAAVMLALPLTALLQHVIGRHGLFVSVPFVFSPYAFLAWVGISLAVLLLACVVPARRARFAAVQDVLAHE